jgi:hypothetical protein
LAGDPGPDCVLRDIGGEQEEADGDEFLGAPLGLWGDTGLPVKRQMMIIEASASIPESIPNPSRATEPARIASAAQVNGVRLSVGGGGAGTV